MILELLIVLGALYVGSRYGSLALGAISVVSSKLRLYCLRLSDRILILGNGGVKKSMTYEQDSELSG